jgi:sulfite reductase beta subunit-like hemoprotein
MVTVGGVADQLKSEMKSRKKQRKSEYFILRVRIVSMTLNPKRLQNLDYSSETEEQYRNTFSPFQSG